MTQDDLLLMFFCGGLIIGILYAAIAKAYTRR